jgi:Arc/MetJ-type ribon-helix-helix transcriptional regulator
MRKFKGISLPAELHKQMKKQVEEGNYCSITEFVQEAIMLRLDALNELPKVPWNHGFANTSAGGRRE